MTLLDQYGDPLPGGSDYVLRPFLDALAQRMLEQISRPLQFHGPRLYDANGEPFSTDKTVLRWKVG